MKCRFCSTELNHTFIDLGAQPPSNSYLKPAQLNAPETYFPLKIHTCSNCWLTQVDEYKHHAEIFSGDYAYFSSFSTSWLKHAEAYVEKMTSRFGLNQNSMVVEVASNDGYLLQYFKQRGTPCLGVEPTASTAKAAMEKGIPTRVEFFGKAYAETLKKEGFSADLMLGNNVLAHVPDINDFVGGFKILLKPEGVITFEFPHLLQLVLNNQFDTIYHEHFSYLSLLTLEKVFAAHGLTIFDVEELPTHGGSLRLYIQHTENLAKRPVEANVAKLREKEIAHGMNDMAFYSGFTAKAEQVKLDFLSFLLEQKRAGKKVLAHGAAAKGNTMLNYCGGKADLLAAVSDMSPHKQGMYLPGSQIPIVAPADIMAQKPDYLVILPWNLRNEISEQFKEIRAWGGKFVVAIPKLEVF